MARSHLHSRILLCGPRPKQGVTGLTLAFELLIQGLSKRGLNHSVVDATFRGDVAKSGAFSLGRALETLGVVMLVWWKLLRHDVYYSTLSTSAVGFWRDYLTIAAASLLKRRIVLHLHGGGFEHFYNEQSNWLRDRIVNTLSSASTIIVLGERLKDQFKCAGESIYNKLVVVPNGLTLGVEEPDIKGKHLLENMESINLLYMSSMIPSKGFMDVINAIIHLDRQGLADKYHLHLCGSFVGVISETFCDIYDEESLNKYLEKNNISQRITYHGQVLGSDKEHQFKQSHIFLLPTYYPWEGQPLSIIEALAYATPVIATPHKGIPEEVIDGLTGCLVNPKSPEKIAGAVRDLTGDRDYYAMISRSARKHYENNFRRSVHVKRLISTILDCEEDVLPESLKPTT